MASRTNDDDDDDDDDVDDDGAVTGEPNEADDDEEDEGNDDGQSGDDDGVDGDEDEGNNGEDSEQGRRRGRRRRHQQQQGRDHRRTLVAAAGRDSSPRHRVAHQLMSIAIDHPVPQLQPQLPSPSRAANELTPFGADGNVASHSNGTSASPRHVRSASLSSSSSSAAYIQQQLVAASNDTRSQLSLSGSSVVDIHASAAPPTRPVVASIEEDVQAVTINVDGQIHRIPLSELRRYPDTMLGRMFGAALDSGLTRKPVSGTFTLDSTHVSPEAFQTALSFYRQDGTITCPPDMDVGDLIEACEYLMIPVSLQTIHCRHLGRLMHILSNRGATNHFNTTFFPQVIAPILEQCVSLGERQVCLVFLFSDDIIKWDDANPPPFDEHIKKVVLNSELCRFLGFAENRELVKEVLQDRGFKRVRLGIEGFPIDMVATEPHRTIAPENLYRYEHRPYIFFSWEKEVKSNQHVNFQFVRKSTSNSTNGNRRLSQERWF